MLIEHIDAIARKKQRDVLYLTFHVRQIDEEVERLDNYAFDEDPVRQQICNWLTQQDIAWQPCGQVADENCLQSYHGQIYVDVPFDEQNAQYQRLQNYLEHPDGRMRNETVIFCYLPLEIAMRNSHHDEPGFWETWAENF